MRLPDGASIVIRPLVPSDREALRSAFERLSPRSRYRRFMSPLGELSEAQLDYLTNVDHHDHEALIATTLEGEGVGVARFVRSDPGTAEVAIAVADDWQGRGLGTALLSALTRRAREAAIRCFTATALADNREIVTLLDRLGGMRVHAVGGGTLEMAVELDGPETLELEFDLPHEEGSGAGLIRALKAAAVGHLRPTR